MKETPNNEIYWKWTNIQHFLRFDETVRKLKAVGAKMEESDVVCHLLLTLPKKYDSLITALESQENEKLTIEFVKSKFIDFNLIQYMNQERSEEPCTAFQNKSGQSNEK